MDIKTYYVNVTRYLSTIDLMATLKQVLLGGIGAAILLLALHLIQGNTKPPIGTVDITHLIDSYVKAKANEHLSAAEKQQQIKAFSERLEKTLQTIVEEHHVVLMPSEAVIAGSIDFTPLLEKHLNESQEK